MAARKKSVGGSGRAADESAHEATVAILRTAEVVRRRLAEVVEPQGVTVQQYHVLRILGEAGAGGLPTLTIADRMIEHAPGVTRLLDRLEASGLVTRTRSEEDRRLVLCSLTAAGQRLLARLSRAVERVNAESVAGLSPNERETLVRLLGRVRLED